MRPSGLVITVLLAAMLVCSESAAAGIEIAGVDGWHTWQTDDATALTQACCFTWQRGAAVRTGCNLDGRHVSYGHRRDCAAASGPVQFYVLMDNGRPRAVRALSGACPVTAESAIRDHGVVAAKDNIEWFRNVIGNAGLDQDIREEALFALVQSGSDTAFEFVDRLLSRR